METRNVTKKRREKTFGQQERYLAVTKSIFNERLKCTGTPWLRNIDITMAVPKIVRKVRRIIEKRMCQTYYKQHKSVFHRCGNKSRHHMKRAVSYELFVMGQVENQITSLPVFTLYFFSFFVDFCFKTFGRENFYCCAKR